MLLRKYLTILLLLLFVAAAVISEPLSRAAEPGHAAAAITEGLISNGGYAVKKNNKYIAAYNLHIPYVPASILKIATALAALDILGPAYRFRTDFYLDEAQNLYIRGYGDPFLVSEEVAAIVVTLRELGCTEINGIFLDNTAFELPGPADGAGTSDNPYDARNSALAVNFNTIHIRKDINGAVVSAEKQTPTLEMMPELAENLPPGTHRVNITSEMEGGAAIMSRYVGELFRAFLKLENITGQGKIATRRTPENLTPIYTHYSRKTLVDIIEPLMRYSNNFIANQIFLSLGTQQYGYPATWDKSIRVIASHLQKKYNLVPMELNIVEGSGLSRNNRVSPRAMIQLLDSFRKYAELLPQENGRYLKTGTLDGVYSYAGYLITDGRLDSFVLMLNQETNNRKRVLDMLEGIYRAEGEEFAGKNKSGTSAD